MVLGLGKLHVLLEGKDALFVLLEAEDTGLRVEFRGEELEEA